MIINLEKCKELTDNEIVRRSIKNLDYFSCLYLRYELEMIRYITQLSGLNIEEAKDILQESFIKIWRNLNEFDSDLKFSTWVYRIVHNETISFMRKRKSYGKDKVQTIEDLYEILPEQEDVEVDFADKSILTSQLLEQLSIKYREVLFLKYFEKKSYEDMSDILKIPKGTVAIRINRAKKILKKMLDKKD